MSSTKLLYSIFWLFALLGNALAQVLTPGVDSATRMLEQDIKKFGLGQMIPSLKQVDQVTNINVVPEQLYKKIQSHVARVFIVEKDSDGKDLKTVSSGSAVAITNNLLITNCHILPKNYDKTTYKVVLQTLHTKSVADVYMSDRSTDRCILQDDRAHHIPVKGFRSKNSLMIGERVYSLGNPKGFDSAFSEGVIAASKKNNKGRLLLLTTAAIAKGSSGGALFDRDGNLVGVTMAVIKDAPHMGIVIPVEDYID